jgi:hypothetical protein
MPEQCRVPAIGAALILAANMASTIRPGLRLPRLKPGRRPVLPKVVRFSRFTICQFMPGYRDCLPTTAQRTSPLPLNCEILERRQIDR